MRMTDETPHINDSFALQACTFSDRQKRTLARRLAEPGIGQNGRANERLPAHPTNDENWSGWTHEIDYEHYRGQHEHQVRMGYSPR